MPRSIARKGRTRELKSITDAIEAYELVRWPEGKIPGGKGSIRE